MSLHHTSDDLRPFVDAWTKDQTASVVRKMREFTGWGMMECKSYLNKAKLIADIDSADSLEKLRELTKYMANNMQWVLR